MAARVDMWGVRLRGDINMYDQWVIDRPNIVSPENLLRLQEAFQDGIVFGDHCIYCGGCSPDRRAFITYNDFLAYLKSYAKPGDLFELWSLPRLLKTGSQLFSRSFSEAGDNSSLLVSAEDLEAVKKYLQVLDPRHSPYYRMKFVPYITPQGMGRSKPGSSTSFRRTIGRTIGKQSGTIYEDIVIQEEKCI